MRKWRGFSTARCVQNALFVNAPRNKAPPASWRIQRGSGVVPKGERPAILLVDPDRAARTPIAHALSERFAVYEVEDGLVAIRLATMIPNLAVVVSEVTLPSFDGLDLAKLFKAHAQLRDVPFVFLSQRATPNDVMRLVSAGARGYVPKTQTPAKIVAAVGRFARE